MADVQSYKMYRTVTEAIYFDAETDEEARTIAQAVASERVEIKAEKWFPVDEAPSHVERIEFSDSEDEQDVIASAETILDWRAQVPERK